MSLSQHFLLDVSAAIEHRLPAAGINIPACQVPIALVMALDVVVNDELTPPGHADDPVIILGPADWNVASG